MCSPQRFRQHRCHRLRKDDLARGGVLFFLQPVHMTCVVVSTTWDRPSSLSELRSCSVERGRDAAHFAAHGRQQIEQREFTPKGGSRRAVCEVIVQRCHLIAP